MCTVIIGYKLFPWQPIVIAANRDEMLDRAAEPPELRATAPKAIFPIDKARGGSWIGMNEDGVWATLTNRVDVKSVWDPTRPHLMKSRGEIVPRALTHGSAAEAVADIVALNARSYNGFNLVVGDARRLFVLRGGGAAGNERPELVSQPDEPGLLIVSNLGIGPEHSPRAKAIMKAWRQNALELGRGAPHRALWDRLLTIHDPELRPGEEWMRRMASTCIHRPEAESYGTRSSAFIVLSAGRGAYDAEWRYWHRERPEGAHACHGRWDRARTLPIIE